MNNRLKGVVTSLVCILAASLLFGQEPLKNVAFEGKTLSPLSASGNKKGDRFSLQVVSPEQYKNAIIEGEVSKAKAAGRVKGTSELLFSFDKLVLADGTVTPITADLTSVANSQGVKEVDEEGRVIGKSSLQKDVVKTAIFSGIGAAIGAAANKDNRGKGAATGAAVGAAVGLTISFATKGEDIKFAPGSVFQLAVNATGKSTKLEAK